MTIRLVEENWAEELASAGSAGGEFQVVCPFIKAGALKPLLKLKPDKVKVITRFNLVDFAEGVSDIAALRMLLDVGAQVRGIRKLHAKLYLFHSIAIITSANLTKSALNSNHEFGIVTDDMAMIATCRNYFNDLWQRGGGDLTRDQIDDWEVTVTHHRAVGGGPNARAGLRDFGANINVAGINADDTNFFSAAVPTVVGDAQQSFVKFQGKSDDRVPLTFSTIEEIERSGCHWAVSYPNSKRPRGVQEDAIIFIGRMTDDNDVRVFGWAVGMKYQNDRDDATPADIERRSWKRDYSRYIRVHHAEFVAGTMSNGVSLSELMEALRANSFAPTQRRAAKGEQNINPRKAYRQQAAVQLSSQGHFWLAERLRIAFDRHGKIPQHTLDELDWPIIPNLA